MSNLTVQPIPQKLVLKPGTYQSQDTKGGLNLNKWIKRFLQKIGFASTVDCCTYYPSVPTIEAINFSTPTEEEMSNVPTWGMFKTIFTDGETFYVWIKAPDGTAVEVANND